VGQDAALQEGVELVLDELRQVGSGGLFGMSEERRGMLLHQAVQRSLLGDRWRAQWTGAPSPCALAVWRALACTRWAWGIWGGAASQGARAYASAYGGISYSRRHGDGPAAARHLAQERHRWPCGRDYCAMASTARSIHRSGSALSTPAQSRRLIKKTESAYPRPRDRRLSRKTRAAVGKPPDATIVLPAVRSADSPGANPPSVRQRENTSTPLLLQTT
jgi:hypothetical protein